LKEDAKALPCVVVHVAVSLDGRTSSSPPVEGGFPTDIGLYYELAGRWKEDATLAGCDTLIAATPEQAEPLDPPPAASESAPLLVVPDSRARLKHWEYWLSQPYWRGAVALCSRSTPVAYLKELGSLGVEAIVAGEERVDYRPALAELRANHGVEVVRVDSGGTLIGALLRSGLVDEVSVLVHPSLCGSSPELSLFRPSDEPWADVISLALRGVEVPRNDIV
jgi:2,5-diamino-6-(ribosylamino)-4(3H)-pyrimidinone 5'-phosphate reductase